MENVLHHWQTLEILSERDKQNRSVLVNTEKHKSTNNCRFWNCLWSIEVTLGGSTAGLRLTVTRKPTPTPELTPTPKLTLSVILKTRWIIIFYKYFVLNVMTISTLFYEFGFCEIVVRIQQFFMIFPTIFLFFN
jgi:hypothetical protein